MVIITIIKLKFLDLTYIKNENSGYNYERKNNSQNAL